MELLLAKLAEKAAGVRADRVLLSKELGNVKVGEVTISQVTGGMRGIPALVCDTSSVFLDSGVHYRDIPILDIYELAPTDIFYLLCTGERPNETEKNELKNTFISYREVPEYVWNVLDAMPADTHPMTLFSTGILAMEGESLFRKAYDSNTPKDELWRSMTQDAVILLSRVTTLAAGIYRKRFGKGERIAPREDLPWGANFAHMLGLGGDNPEGFAKLINMYLVLHADHGAGNVSACTAGTVASALSDIYYSLSAGLNGLAGPLHGLANQECLKFVMDLYEKFGGVPTDEQMTALLWERLNNRQVIPGYGHAILRVEDPRFTAFYRFAKENVKNDPIFETVDVLYRCAPKVLTEQGKAANVNPNVDAASGSLLYHYGMTEYDFYTVMFGVSRAMGIAAQLINNRLALAPITRPNDLSTKKLKELANA